jgi:ketosteroid isomerase-like protein
MKTISSIHALGIVLVAMPALCHASPNDEKIVAALDTEYQAAVLKKDVAAMDRLLPANFVLVSGKGKVFGKPDLLAEERRGDLVFTHQEDTQQTVRVWGDTAVVTALLHVAGTDKGQPFDYSLWFSDVYLRTPQGWRYTFGQASIRLPAETPPAHQ